MRIAAANLIRLFWIGTSLLLLQGCSTVKFGYQQLDTILSYYAGQYVTLNDSQTERFQENLEQFLRWHCESELSGYAQWLRSVNEEVQAGRADHAAVATRYAELQVSWNRLLDRSVSGLAPILPTLSDAQVEEFFQRLEKDNRRLRADTAEPPLARRRELARRMMERQLERWVGSLTPAQEQSLRAWSEGVGESASENRLAMRAAWQQELRTILARRTDSDETRKRLLDLMREPQRVWPADYARYRAARRDDTLRLVADVVATLTPQQRRYFAQRTEGWAQDFDSLVCRG